VTRKLPEKQKARQNNVRQFGKVEIPQDAFIATLKMDGEQPEFTRRALFISMHFYLKFFKNSLHDFSICIFLLIRDSEFCETAFE